MSEIATPTVDGLEFYSRWGCAGDGENVILASDARELERANITLSARVAALEAGLREAVEMLSKIKSDFDEQAPRLREVTGNSLRFQIVEDVIEEGSQALTQILTILQPA